jgi:hypothetical protein
VLVLSLAVNASARREPSLALEERKVAQIGVGQQDDVAAVSTVAAVRASLGDVFLPPEAERPVAAAAPAHLDAGAVVEHPAP